MNLRVVFRKHFGLYNQHSFSAVYSLERSSFSTYVQYILQLSANCKKHLCIPNTEFSRFYLTCVACVEMIKYNAIKKFCRICLDKK